MNHLHESAMRIQREDGVLILLIVILGLWVLSNFLGQQKNIV
jgi:hypothetical protein